MPRGGRAGCQVPQHFPLLCLLLCPPPPPAAIHLVDPRDAEMRSRARGRLGRWFSVPGAVGPGTHTESPPADADEARSCLRVRELRARVGLAPTLGTGSLATFCSARLLSQQPRRGPPGIGAWAASLAWGILPSEVLRGECGPVRWAGLGSHSLSARAQAPAFPAPWSPSSASLLACRASRAQAPSAPGPWAWWGLVPNSSLVGAPGAGLLPPLSPS